MIRPRGFLVMVAVAAACGGGGDDTAEYDGGVAGDDAAAPTADAPPPIPDAAPPADAACMPTDPSDEVCDGVDNDCNGLIDDRDTGGDGIYDCLRIALFGTAGSGGSSDFVAWLNSNGTTVERIQTDATELTAEILDQYDLIILDRLVRDYTPAEAALLRAWVEAGGGLMSMTGYSGAASERDRPNGLMAEIGLAYLAGLHNGPVTEWATHPISEGITSVTFNGGYYVAEVEGVTGGTNTVVATITAEPVGIAQERGAGRVFVWGDEWIEFDSQWSSMPMIPQLWANITAWLTGFK